MALMSVLGPNATALELPPGVVEVATTDPPISEVTSIQP